MTGVFIRVERDDRWQNIEFEYLTEEEQMKVMHAHKPEWTASLCLILAKTIAKVPVIEVVN